MGVVDIEDQPPARSRRALGAKRREQVRLVRAGRPPQGSPAARRSTAGARPAPASARRRCAPSSGSAQLRPAVEEQDRLELDAALGQGAPQQQGAHPHGRRQRATGPAATRAWVIRAARRRSGAGSGRSRLRRLDAATAPSHQQGPQSGAVAARRPGPVLREQGPQPRLLGSRWPGERRRPAPRPRRRRPACRGTRGPPCRRSWVPRRSQTRHRAAGARRPCGGPV